MERQHVGDRIKDLRIHHGMTLKELGDVIDFNYSNLSKIERGIRKPTIGFLETLSNYFNIEISYFFRKNEKTLKEYGDWVKLSEEMKQKNITLQEIREFVETLKS
ncbi:helix-turn-helix domain-containing protein [Neobacillus drentensis]|uniref:helix-turn-helix domain-containing protein n=1 Tax=Neobacillus drentensis TaxID=220684 RepID=UPI001F28D745|nr:helix-turn-helix transcriptional regulator [Neobacillus drentensis]ULT56215.1 helix-turn-helix domain-containing protein [Neobacillus drentensis]